MTTPAPELAEPRPALRHMIAVYRSLPDGEQKAIDLAVVALRQDVAMKRYPDLYGTELEFKAASLSDWAFWRVLEKQPARAEALKRVERFPEELSKLEASNRARASGRAPSIEAIRKGLDSKQLSPLAVAPLRDVRDGQLAAAGPDRWEEGRE